MKIAKKSTAIIITVLMIICMLPINALASVTGNDKIVHTGEYDTEDFSFVATYPENFNGRYTLPVIIWCGGTGTSSGSYESLIDLLAKDGYIVVTSTDNLLYDGTVPSAAIDYIIAQNEDESSPLYKKVDTDRIGVGGHSLGGRNAVNVAANDTRVKAIVSIAGSTTESERVAIETPALYISGENDTVMSAEEWVEPMYKASNGPAVYVCAKGADHILIFSNPKLYAYYISNWFYTWLYEDQETKEIFVSGGELSEDNNFIDYKSKNFKSEYRTTTTTTTSVSDSSDASSQNKIKEKLSITSGEIVVMVLVVAVLIALIIVSTRRKKKDNNK